MLQSVFYEMGNESGGTASALAGPWIEVVNAYSASDRYYHTLAHLENMWQQLSPVRKYIADWQVVLFSLFYHDFVYKVLHQENEEQSAVKAWEVMTALHIPVEKKEHCKAMILATKHHFLHADPDINYFIDADLSVLGMPEEIYWQYAENVRKEYAVYPDEIYVPGRIKVLQHFLQQPSVFKTGYFCKKMEIAARSNLNRELQKLLNMN